MATAESVFNKTETILDFICLDQNALKYITILQIYNLVTQIQNAITPLLIRRPSTFTPHLQQCLTDTQAVLGATHKNLKAWNDGKSRRMSALLRKRAPTKELKVDIEFLLIKHTALVAAAQMVPHVKGYNIVSPTSSIRQQVETKSVLSLKMKTKVVDSDQSSLFETDQFWRSYFGDETEIAESEEFCDILSLWMDEPLSEIARERLLLRLDEHKTGCVSLTVFQDFVKNGNLRETVHSYISEPRLPLLIWVDDDVSSIVHKVLEAVDQKITVVQLASTATAKRWITINKDFLLEHGDAGSLRFTASQILHEPNDYHIKSSNDEAGLQLTNYVREKGIKAPILIYTSKSNLHLTKFVEEHENVGSLAGNYLVFQAYVASLAARRKDDKRWMKFNA